MLSKKMHKALNEQINAEIFSWYLYLSMAAYFNDQDLPGFGTWMAKQGEEELTHAKKIWDYIYDRRGAVELLAIDKPDFKWNSPLDAFNAAFKHEQYITKRINDLVSIARTEKDNATENFLQWFVAEQVEEEASVDAIIAKIKLAGSSPGALYHLDHLLSSIRD